MRDKLNQRKEDNNFRKLSLHNNSLIDFCSNDYLGLAKNDELKKNIIAKYSQLPLNSGSTGSRLLTGNYIEIEQLEEKIAKYHNYEKALLFSSGYLANTGLLSCIATRHDTYIFDEQSHASIKDGVRMSNAKQYSFKHNDLEDLEKKIKQAQGACFIVVESVYSMEGDFSPLIEISKLSEQYGCMLIVDEAHSAGIFGKKGEGIVSSENLSGKVFATIVTYGKAFGCQGAAILCSEELYKYLINFSRPFIYTTAISPVLTCCISESYNYINNNTDTIKKLNNNINHYIKNVTPFKNEFISKNLSAVQYLKIHSTTAVKNMSLTLQNQGFLTKSITYPTVPKNKERIRIILHSYNSFLEIEKLFNVIKRNFCNFGT